MKIGGDNKIRADSHKPVQCAGCPLEHIGVGFVPGTFKQQPLIIIAPETHQAASNIAANLSDARLAFCGEAPAHDEYLAGRPFAGKAGGVLKSWVFDNAGVSFDDVMIDNVIRCVQPGNELPDKPVLTAARKHCSVYDRWAEFAPEIDVVTFHPAALLRDIVPLPLVVHDVGRARELSEKSRVRVLLGKTAVQKFYGYISNLTRWRGNVERQPNISGLE